MHRLSCFISGTCLLLASLSLASGAPVSQEDLDFFEAKVRPVLVNNCYECHSLEASKSKGGLLVDSREGLVKGGDRGPAIVPGEPEKSLLITAIRYGNEDLQMPPKHRLPDEQVADLARWIGMGAPDPRRATEATTALKGMDVESGKQFWSFRPIQNPQIPEVHQKSWPRTALDFFVLASLESRNFSPAPETEKRTWLRRVTFDLTGLPPAPADVEAFINDSSEEAYHRVVERLLGSPAYGERWGRHWLDVVRYADTAGDSSDYPVPQAYKYRDYVIRSFNQDKPFDRFITEQIAGDLLPFHSEEEKYENIVATGYLAIARRFGVNPEFVQHLTIEDTIDNLGKAMLGLSVSCARCHDHKYDPISAADYYALYGIFQSTRYPFAGSENERRQRDLVPLIPEDDYMRLMKPINEELAPLDEKIEALVAEIGELRKAQKEGIEGERTITNVRDEIRELRRKKDQIVAKAPDFAKAFAMAEGKPRNAKIHLRGEPFRQGDEVPRRFLEVLGAQKLPEDYDGSGRLELAKWITDPANPLTARVMVNRVWQHHFGKGLVQTPNDFGVRGKPPTHPELLDSLAQHFIQEGWSIKALHRMILLSSTYRQSSSPAHDYTNEDPNNEMLWKFDRRRLDAEAIRDSLLAVSGNLEQTRAGEHPFPEQKRWGYTQHAPFQGVYQSNKRSVYLMQQRIKKHPYLEIFDGADPNASTDVRRINITPLQALFMMNDPFAHAQSDGFARLILAQSADDLARIQFAHYTAFGRPAGPEDIGRLQAYIAEFRERTSDDAQLWASVARVLFSSNEFVFVD